jgi:hypothetical protein
MSGLGEATDGDAGDGETAVTSGCGLPEPGDVEVERDDVLLDGEGAEGMKKDIRRGSSDGAQGDEITLSAREKADPVAGVAESLFQAREDIDRLRRRRLDALDESFVEADGDVPPEDLKGGLAFDVQRARTGKGAFETDFE